jgi:two-component system, LytTR family, sensor histidine kinase AlgZ
MSDAFAKMPTPLPETKIIGSRSNVPCRVAQTRLTFFGACMHPSREICHIGVLLRSLLGVHVVCAIGLLFVSSSWNAWLIALGVSTSVALPAVLLWMLLSCVLQASLRRVSVGLQRLFALFSGALVTLACALPWWWMGWSTWEGSQHLAMALAGAGFAGVLFEWLSLRARAQIPAQTTARLAELQSRIRPHFLFNTLNSALALVRHDPTRAELVLEDLAELFRVALSSAEQAVTLGEELDLVQRYLAIEQIRFGERLRVQWDVDPAAQAARLPPLLLQPLLENAVHHGVEPSPEGGWVRISVKVQGRQVELQIRNSVSGQPSQSGHGMALNNVRERLHLMHDVSARFEIQQTAGEFQVRLLWPL